MGAWIAPGGSNFWGVEQFTADNGERLIAGSDRDYGMVILRYTGPSAVGPTPAAPPPSTQPPSGGGTTPLPTDKKVLLRKRTLTVGKNRRFKVAVNCPASTGTVCVGTLRVESGRRILAKQRFRITAGTYRNVSVRLTKARYRTLKRKRNGQKVTVSVLTRDAAKTLRLTSVRMTLRAKR